MSLGSLSLGHYVQLTLTGVLALCLGQQALSATPIVINEIMYHSKSTEWKEDDSAEYIELYHAGEKPISLESWRFSSGIRYTFPAVTLTPGGFLIIAADPNALRVKHPNIATVLGPYRGQLSNGGEKITLEDADERTVDEVTYADSGRWAQRVSTKLKGNDDWIWRAPHDGDGKSLSLKSPLSNNKHGEHWGSSNVDGGTPGKENDIYFEKIAPVVVSVNHRPAIPKSTEPVVVRAKIDHASPVTVTLHYRLDGETAFQSVPMKEGAGSIPPQSNKTIVQFYVRAEDDTGSATDYPTLNRDDSGRLTQRQPVCLYQVDNSFNLDAEQAPGARPTYRIVTTADEVSLMRNLAAKSGRSNVYNNHLHLTFIAVDGVEIDVRYNVTARIRGHGSRSAFPPGMRVSFPSDDPWRGITDINLNTQFTQSQSIGAAIHQLLGSHSAGSTPVVVTMNGSNWAKKGSPQFGCYVHNEVLDGAFVERHFPDEEDGNLYRLVASAYLNERKTDMTTFRKEYNKRNHSSDDDYTDMFTLIETLRQTKPEETYYDRVNEIADLEQWAHYIALDALMCNTEGGMPDGRGDDVALFRRKNGRFQFIPYDLDSILGMGDDGQRIGKDVFGYGNMSGLRAIFKNSRFLKLYTDSIIRLTETTYRPKIIHRLIDEQWSGWVPDTQIKKVKGFVVDRIANVLSQIQSSTVVASTLEQEGAFYKAPSATFALYGRFDYRTVTRVSVGGEEPKIFKETGMWIMPPDRLQKLVRPGMNQIPVVMLNDEGDVVEEQLMRVWLDSRKVTKVHNSLPDNTTITWTPEGGPYLIDGAVLVPETATLVIQGGTTVYAGKEASLDIMGNLRVEGEAMSRVTFAKNPGDPQGPGWQRIMLPKATKLSEVDWFNVDGPIIAAGNLHLSNVNMQGGTNFSISGKRSVTIEDSKLTQLGDTPTPLIKTSGSVTLIRSQLSREGTAPAVHAVKGNVDAFACTFQQASAPVMTLKQGFIDGCDFNVASSTTGALWKTSATEVVATRNRATGGKGATLVASLAQRDLPAADCRYLSQPPSKTSNGNVRFQIGGEGLAAFRYQVDDEEWTAPVSMGGQDSHDLTLNLSPGKHVVRIVGNHVSGRWQSEEQATESRPFEIVPGLPALVLSEVLAINESAHEIKGNYNDYIEIQNLGIEPLDLGGFSLSDHPDKLSEYTFPKETIVAPGGFHLVTATKDDQGFALSGDGDTVYLSRDDEIIDSVTFGLQLADHSISRSEEGSWTLSTPTPKTANSFLPLGESKLLRFTEWFAIPDVRSPDEFLELTNASKIAVDLGGMTITDRIPNKSVWNPLTPLSFIAAESSQVFLADGSPKKGANHLDFRLSNEGEAIGLFDRNGMMVDFVIYGPQASGISQRRADDGSLIYARPSPGVGASTEGAGTPPPSSNIRISEIHYHPSTVEDEEFIELANVSDQPVSLATLAFVSGIEHEFSDLQLEPYSRGVVVKDRQAFTTRYGTEATIIGEYKGKLSNSGERLSLETVSGETLIEFNYKDKWHKTTDGKGYSLTLSDLSSKQLATKKAWQPSDEIGGTPGK